MIATYRLQLSPEQDFAAVRALVPYLRELGISHLYLSPSLQARTGSTHGYDVVDPTRVSDALGGEEGLRALAGEGLRIVLDIVPNHMGVSDENRWWADERERARVFDYDPDDGWYRRFFDIDDLAGVRVEDPEVFELVHGKVLELVRDGVVDGLRVDHPDGLADPAGYLARLRDAGAEHVWVEKILHTGEPLRDWPVEGTVGYEFLNDAAALFVDPAGEAALARLPQRRRAVRGGGGARPARAGDDDLRARGRSACASCSTSTASPRRWRRCRSTAPTWSRGRGASRTPTCARSRPPPTAGSPTCWRCASAATTSSSRAFSRPRRRSRRRGSRTPPSTATCGCSRSTRSAATRRASGSRSTPSTPPTRRGPSASRAGCSSPRPTTPSARATCARASAR